MSLDQDIGDLQRKLGAKLRKKQDNSALASSSCGVDEYTVASDYDEFEVWVINGKVFRILIRKYVPQTRPILLASRFFDKYGAPTTISCLYKSKPSIDTSILAKCDSADSIILEYGTTTEKSEDEYEAYIGVSSWDPNPGPPAYMIRISRGLDYHYDRINGCREAAHKRREEKEAQEIKIPPL